MERRESACPVHFLWDGCGRGRWFVRLGFLGFLAAGLLWAASRTFVVDLLEMPAAMIAIASAFLYAVGHALSMKRNQRPARRGG